MQSMWLADCMRLTAVALGRPNELHGIVKDPLVRVCVCVCVRACVCVRVCVQVAAHMRKLTSIDWLAVPTGNIETAHMQVTVHCTRDNQALQTALLNIARQLRIQYTRNSTLRLLRWPMTRATIEAWQPGRGLQHILSSERIRLDLSQCGYWPLTPEEYVSLLTQSTPEDFLVWKLPRTRKHLALRRAYEGRAAVAEEEVTIEIDEPV